MTVPVWITPISMVVYTVLLMLLTEFMRRHYRTSMWVWVVSLVTIPLWIINIPGDDWFRWAKNLSVILPLIFAGLGRIAAVQQKDTPFWRLMRKRWVRWTLYGIVFCNIAEATLRDMQMGNMMNALAGFILCVTMPFGDKYWKYDTSSHGEILSYTVPMWNFHAGRAPLAAQLLPAAVPHHHELGCMVQPRRDVLVGHGERHHRHPVRVLVLLPAELGEGARDV